MKTKSSKIKEPKQKTNQISVQDLNPATKVTDQMDPMKKAIEDSNEKFLTDLSYPTGLID